MRFNLDDAHKIALKAQRIRDAQDALAGVRRKLAQVNKAAEKYPKRALTVSVIYEMGDTYGNGRKTVDAYVSIGVIQQAMIYEVMAAERALVTAEESPL